MEHHNDRFEILRLIRENIKIRYHRDLPKNYKMCSITISKDATGYFVSFGIEFQKEINLVVTSENLDRTKSIGIDLNVNNFAISKPLNGEQLLDNGSQNRRAIQFGKTVKILQKKQSKIDIKTRKLKVKKGKNYQKTQRKINRLKKQQSNKKSDLYHKIIYIYILLIQPIILSLTLWAIGAVLTSLFSYPHLLNSSDGGSSICNLAFLN